MVFCFIWEQTLRLSAYFSSDGFSFCKETTFFFLITIWCSLDTQLSCILINFCHWSMIFIFLWYCFGNYLFKFVLSCVHFVGSVLLKIMLLCKTLVTVQGFCQKEKTLEVQLVLWNKMIKRTWSVFWVLTSFRLCSVVWNQNPSCSGVLLMHVFVTVLCQEIFSGTLVRHA